MLRIRTGRAVGHMIPIERLTIADDTLLVRRVILRMDGQHKGHGGVTAMYGLECFRHSGGLGIGIALPLIRCALTNGLLINDILIDRMMMQVQRHDTVAAVLGLEVHGVVFRIVTKDFVPCDIIACTDILLLLYIQIDRMDSQMQVDEGVGFGTSQQGRIDGS